MQHIFLKYKPWINPGLFWMEEELCRDLKISMIY